MMSFFDGLLFFISPTRLCNDVFRVMTWGNSVNNSNNPSRVVARPMTSLEEAMMVSTGSFDGRRFM
jgi:hypothetical protein